MAVVDLSSTWDGTHVSIEVRTQRPFRPGWRLALTSVAPLGDPGDGSARVVERVGTSHVIEPVPARALGAGDVWTLSGLLPGFALRHANDGPVSASMISVDDTPYDVAVQRTVWPGAPPIETTVPTSVAGSGFAGDPRFEWRGLHIDLARQWFEPTVVEWLIEQAAARRLNRVHLHLTDDEGWRLPVAGYPDLALAATRGHGLVMPPMLGGGPEPTGRLYEPAEITEWTELADGLGVTLVPEVDLPAHMHAALSALPNLRDPDDTSHAESVQGFVDNVLVPGHAPTDAFVRAVVDSVASLFPNSPWIHIGGDEVPEGAWSASPIAQRYAAERGVAGSEQIAASFHRELIALVRERTGRKVGVWHEAALSGGMSPEDGYVVSWQSVRIARSLAQRGYDVVLAPGSAYYFDMALDDRWDSPGASWAGSVSVERVCDFDPGRGWTDEELAHLIGVQSCLWTEHVHDRRTLEHLLLGRLDAFAERAWTGQRPSLVPVE